MDVERSLLLPHSYEIDVLDEFSSSTIDVPRYYYPGARQDGGADGLLVRVDPASGLMWLGVFAFWDRGSVSKCGVFSCPDVDVVCVVSAGKGYIVHTDKPAWWSEVPTLPIKQVLQLPERGMIVFSDLTTVCAFNQAGLAWRTARLAWDRLQITAVKGDRILGTGWDPTRPTQVPFSIDLATGQHEGGSSPPA